MTVGTAIDLHAHSNASDGTDTPAELVLRAADAGLVVLALTDHDTTAGWAPATEARPTGLTLIRGAEISCRWHGAQPAVSLHLLGYLFDPTYPPLADELDRVRAARTVRGERIVDLLRADGIDITWDEVLGYAAGGTVGRPHIAQALIRAGLVASTDEAFRPQWLGQRYRLPKNDLDVFTAVRLVQEAGGVTVFAHPLANRRGRTVPDSMIAELAAAGLTGLEVDHVDHDPAERAHGRRLADDLGLVATGSSDYHGSHKTVELGANTTSVAAYEQLIAKAHGVPPL